MRTLLTLSLLSVAVLAAPSTSQAWWAWPNVKVDAGAAVWCNIKCADQMAPRYPWYTYWPQEAHFQMPAPVGYPNWPSNMNSWMQGQGQPGGGQPGLFPPGGPPIPDIKPDPKKNEGKDPKKAEEDLSPTRHQSFSSPQAWQQQQPAAPAPQAYYYPYSYYQNYSYPTTNYYQVPSYWYGR